MNEVIGKHYLDLDIHQNNYVSFTCKQDNSAEHIYVTIYDNGEHINNLTTLLTSLDVKIETPDSRHLKLSTSDVFYGGVPSGYKVLKQDKFEMYISYIISQNNNVKRISSTINKISEKYGEKVEFNNKTYYLFPKMSDMINLTKDNLKEFNLGFRDEYINNALNVLKENPFYLEELDMLNTDVALKSLMKIKGIGLKVASCILMFGYSRFDTFPIDTWVKKYVSEKLGIKDDIKVISKYMKEIFNEYSGLAIQYMYHINRNRKLD